MIELHQVGHVHDAGTPWEARALAGIDLRIAEGERVLFTGRNGSGKSTLAWVIAGHIEPSEGSALVGGNPATDSVTTTGLLLQHTRLQILAPTVQAEGARYGVDPLRHRHALAALGFDDSILLRKIDEMSLGQQRRVALACLLARQCPVLVLDEPLAGLDRKSVERFLDVVDQLPRTSTLITITHDIEASARLGSRVIELDAGRLVDE